MTQYIRNWTSDTPGERPDTGELPKGAVGFNRPDRQLFVGGPEPVDYLPIRQFSPEALYVAGDLIATGGAIYRATRSLPAGEFNPDDWAVVTNLDAFPGLGLRAHSTAQALRDAGPGAPCEGRVTLGALSVGDGGGGTWRWDASAVDDDNGITVLLPPAHVGAGRWVAQWTARIQVHAGGDISAALALACELSRDGTPARGIGANGGWVDVDLMGLTHTLTEQACFPDTGGANIRLCRGVIRPADGYTGDFLLAVAPNATSVVAANLAFERINFDCRGLTGGIQVNGCTGTTIDLCQITGIGSGKVGIWQRDLGRELAVDRTVVEQFYFGQTGYDVSAERTATCIQLDQSDCLIGPQTILRYAGIGVKVTRSPTVLRGHYYGCNTLVDAETGQGLDMDGYWDSGPIVLRNPRMTRIRGVFFKAAVVGTGSWDNYPAMIELVATAPNQFLTGLDISASVVHNNALGSTDLIAINEDSGSFKPDVINYCNVRCGLSNSIGTVNPKGFEAQGSVTRTSADLSMVTPGATAHQYTIDLSGELFVGQILRARVDVEELLYGSSGNRRLYQCSSAPGYTLGEVITDDSSGVTGYCTWIDASNQRVMIESFSDGGVSAISGAATGATSAHNNTLTSISSLGASTLGLVAALRSRASLGVSCDVTWGGLPYSGVVTLRGWGSVNVSA